MKVGITGGIGSGKSFVKKIFESLGAVCYDSDIRAKYLIQNDGSVREAIIKVFGQKAYLQQEYQSKWMASIVFSNPFLLSQLNQITHPAVDRDFALFCEAHRGQIILYESALMMETGRFKEFDKVILVTAPMELRIQRVMARERTTEEAIRKRIQVQLSDDVKRTMCDYEIVNIFEEDTALIVNKIWKEWNEKIS